MENADKKAPVREAGKAKDATEPKPTIFIDIKVEGVDMEDPDAKKIRKHPKILYLCIILWVLTFWAFLYFLLSFFLFYLFMWVGVPADFSGHIGWSFVIMNILLCTTGLLQCIFFFPEGRGSGGLW